MTGRDEGNGSRWWHSWIPVIAAAVAITGVIGNYFMQQGVAQQNAEAMNLAIHTLSSRVDITVQRVGALELSGTKNDTIACQQLTQLQAELSNLTTMLNEIHVNDLRDRAILWKKTMGEDYPPQFFPIPPPPMPSSCGTG